MSVDDFDVLACYRDLWKTKSEKRNAIHQGIISNDGCTENCIKLRINAGNKDATNAQDKAIADAYGNKFIIPLDFEMLDSAAPYYQVGLGNRLCYELTFNDYNRVIKSAVSSPKVLDAKYKITDIPLEYEISGELRQGSETSKSPQRSLNESYQNGALNINMSVQYSQELASCVCIQVKVFEGLLAHWKYNWKRMTRFAYILIGKVHFGYVIL